MRGAAWGGAALVNQPFMVNEVLLQSGSLSYCFTIIFCQLVDNDPPGPHHDLARMGNKGSWARGQPGRNNGSDTGGIHAVATTDSGNSPASVAVAAIQFRRRRTGPGSPLSLSRQSKSSRRGAKDDVATIRDLVLPPPPFAPGGLPPPRARGTIPTGSNTPAYQVAAATGFAPASTGPNRIRSGRRRDSAASG
jgi:hypothetical protein